MSDSNSLRDKVLTGLKWSVLAKVLMQLLSWASTFFVIRMLAPNDYGIIALSTIIFTFINTVTVSGFCSTLIKRQATSRQEKSQVFTISLSLNIFFSFWVFVFAGDIARYFDSEELEQVLYVMALVTPFTCLVIVPSASLSIAMNFKRKAFCDGASQLVSTVIAVVSAYMGMAFWALVFSKIGALFSSIVFLHMASKSSYSLTRSFKDARDVISYTMNLQLNAMIWFLYNRFDSVLVGKTLGVGTLGIYNVAVEVASIPMAKVSSIINQVGFSAFSSLKEDPSSTRYYLRRSLRLMALIIFPVFWGISVCSYELVAILLGEKWLDSAPLIAIFCLVFPLRMLNSVIQNYVNSMNLPSFNVINTTVIAVVLLSSILVGLQYGLLATAFAWVIGFSFAFAIVLIRVARRFKLDFRTLGGSWLVPLIPAMLMWVVVYCVSITFIPASASLFLVLAVKIILGVGIIAIIYFLAFFDEVLLLLNRKSRA